MKKIINLAILFLLVSSLCFGQDSYEELNNEEKIQYLEDNFGITGVLSENVIVSGTTATITGGNPILQERGKNVDIILEGGDVDVALYSGEISFGSTEGGKIITRSGKFFNFGLGGSVVVVNGEITAIRDGEVIEGSIRGYRFSGTGINWDAKTNKIANQRDPVYIYGTQFSSEDEFDVDFSQGPPIIDSKGGWVKGPEGKFNGRIQKEFFIDREVDSFRMLSETEIVTSDSTIKVDKTTDVKVFAPCPPSLTISCIEVKVDSFRVIPKKDTAIELKVFDKDKNKVQVDKIDDASTVKLVIEKEDKTKAIIDFSKDRPIEQGVLADLQTKIIHRYENKEWVLENGRVRPCEEKCKDKGILYVEFIDLSDRAKNVEIEKAIYGDMKSYKKFIQSTAKQLGVDPKTVAAVLYVEKGQYELNTLRKGKATMLQFLGKWDALQKNVVEWAGLSSGYAHIKWDTAEDTKHELDKKPELKGFLSEEDIDAYSNNPQSSIKIAAGMLRVLQDQWKNDPNGVDISNRPEILGTLYNIGYQNSKPKKDPRAGGTDLPVIIDGQFVEDVNFGNRVKMAYDSEQMNALFR